MQAAKYCTIHLLRSINTILKNVYSIYFSVPRRANDIFILSVAAVRARHINSTINPTAFEVVETYTRVEVDHLVTFQHNTQNGIVLVHRPTARATSCTRAHITHYEVVYEYLLRSILCLFVFSRHNGLITSRY